MCARLIEQSSISEFPFSVSTSFSSFARIFVPGWFTAFLVVIYAVRLSHFTDIFTASKLLTYLHTNWAGIVGITFALGSFLGFCLVGIDLVIRIMIGSRFVKFFFKYLASSRYFGIQHFRFMLYHDMHNVFGDLPIVTVGDEKNKFPSALIEMERKGTEAERWVLNEVLRSHFWYNLSPAKRNQMSKTHDYSSMYSSLAIGTSVFFLFQLGFFVNHLCVELLFADSVFLIIVVFIAVNFVSNLRDFHMTYRNVPTHKFIKNSLEGAEKKRNYLLILAIIPIAMLTQNYVYTKLPWFSMVDVFLLVAFFGLSVSLLWASSMEFSRFILSYEREFLLQLPALRKFAIENLSRIREIIIRYH